MALSGCATGTTATQTPAASNEPPPPPTAGASVGQRDLTAPEKKVIMDAIGPSLRNPGSAKYRWAKFPAVVNDDSVNYCATVDAQSPYAAYSGRQAYIIEATVVGGCVVRSLGPDRRRQGFRPRHQHVREIRPRSEEFQLASAAIANCQRRGVQSCASTRYVGRPTWKRTRKDVAGLPIREVFSRRIPFGWIGGVPQLANNFS